MKRLIDDPDRAARRYEDFILAWRGPNEKNWWKTRARDAMARLLEEMREELKERGS